MKTPLYFRNQELGAKITNFHGWDMPIHYPAGIIEEHRTVRNEVGIFDVSHMGEILMGGDNINERLQGLSTNNILSLEIGKSVYTHLLDERGFIIDDTIIFRTAEEQYLMVPNASTAKKVYSWVIQYLGSKGIDDLSSEYSCLAIQGPKSMELISKIFGPDIMEIKKFHFGFYEFKSLKDNPIPSFHESLEPNFEKLELDICQVTQFESQNNIMISNTGYTGEKGFELIVKNELAVFLWDLIMSEGQSFGIKPIGLGARDTLRLEMGYLLSGQDFNGSHTPLESNCAWVVKWEHEFIGKQPLLKQKEERAYPKLTGIILEGKAVARPGFEVHVSEANKAFPKSGEANSYEIPVEMEGSPASGKEEISTIKIGYVTSGNFSPTLGRAIALARIDREHSKPGTELELVQGKRRLKGVVAKPPFIEKR